MIRIGSCDAIAALLRAYKSAESEADRMAQGWQKQIKEGDCFRRVTSDGLEVFGEVLGRGLSESWRRCRCYSIACPEGEAGSVHVSQFDALISREAFESARDKLVKAHRGAVDLLKG